MDPILVILLVIVSIVPMILAYRACVSAQGVEVNHVLLFTAGYLAYWILPIAVGSSHVAQDLDSLQYWYAVYDAIDPAKLIPYLLICLLFYLSFWYGSRVGARTFTRTPAPGKSLFVSRKVLDLYAFFAVVFSAFLAYQLRDELFRGYLVDPNDIQTPRSAFTACAVFLLSLAILYSTILESRFKTPPRFSRLILHRYWVIYFIVAVLLISLGQRLYFLSSLIMLVVYRSVYFRRVRTRTCLGFVAAMLIFSGVAGVIRLGVGLDFAAAGVILLAEPILTAFSLNGFLRDNSFALLNPPLVLLSSFQNLIPSVLLPNKADLILSPSDLGYTVLSPLGAFNSFPSFIINFGVIGTVVVLFLFAFFLQYLKSRRSKPLCKTMYILISGWIAFSFFRDPFWISIVKAIFQFSIVTPALVAFSLYLLSPLTGSEGRRRFKRSSGDEPTAADDSGAADTDNSAGQTSNTSLPDRDGDGDPPPRVP